MAKVDYGNHFTSNTFSLLRSRIIAAQVHQQQGTPVIAVTNASSKSLINCSENQPGNNSSGPAISNSVNDQLECLRWNEEWW
ncbi:hypothetical protein E2C01_027347 [Portunus trituberculatus]|uniref:Uncharacterized protein n=1 Tax=Portunus trituberculatus TaxID=210409 RepID=A0A5B7EL38_PORTR|nr:hypothetical protein [Portunus trituberculatus]